MLKRISLTIDGEILSRVDRLVDSGVMKNRSQAISALASSALREMSVSKAFVLAGKNHFLLEKILHWLKKNGIVKAVIAAGKNDEIAKSFGNGSGLGMELAYLHDEGKGTALAIEGAKALLKEPFVLCYSDVFCEELMLKDLLSFHDMQKTPCTLVLTWSKQPSKYGVAKMLGARIIDFEEKPSSAEGFLINAGIAVCNPSVFSLFEGPSFEKDALPAMAKQGNLSGYAYYGKWTH